MAVGAATSETVYEPVPFWAKIPHGVWLKEATSVAVDSRTGSTSSTGATCRS